ncbi:MAG: methyl-accepting chemotaxis protein [Alphaproteobacteria bacterium]|jgi:methyl-accepting chemotaxis protein|nr:methyl-accepting chemotaxis protein [Alphaproteobacteria bacterium]
MSSRFTLPFKWKILIAPVVVIFFVVALSLVSFQALTSQQSALNQIVEGSFVEKEKATDIVRAVKDVDASLLGLLSLQIAGASDEKVQRSSKAAQEKIAALKTLFQSLGDSAKDKPEAEQKRLSEIQTEIDGYLNLVGRVLGMTEIDQNAALTMKISKNNIYEHALDKLIAYENNSKDSVSTVYARAKNEAGHTEKLFLLICAASVLISIVVTWTMTSSLSHTLNELSSVMIKVSEGDHTAVVPATSLKDEIGTMARALAVFKQNTLEMENLRKEQESNRVKAEEDKRAMLSTLADNFDAEVNSSVGEVSSSAQVLQQNATNLSAAAEQTKNQSQKVEESTRSAASNISAASAAAEELAASIREITQQVGNSARVTQEAVSEVNQTNATIASLTQATEKIGTVVQLIQEIASQTNLLALNATIEAARAGEAGKGFAVVASEVKALANQTSKATDEITAQITHVQRETTNSVTAMNGVGKTIAHLNEIAATIAAAVEEQSAATQEISRSVLEASDSTQTVVQAIGEVHNAAIQTEHAAADVLQASSNLSKDSHKLKGSVEHFLEGFRA